MRKEDKSTIIEQIAATVKEYGHFYLVDVTAMNAAATSALRRDCFKSDIKLMLVKNTLLHKALESLEEDFSPLYGSLKGTTAVMFSNTGPMAYFQDYLHHGFYPFFLEKRNFSENLLKTMNMMLEVDVLYIKQIEQSYLPKLRKLLYLLATSAPCTPNVSQLSKDIETSRATVMNYIKYLTDARLMNMLYPVGESFPKKPSKVYMYNSNLMYPIRPMEVNAGAVRESFFYNQLLKDNKLNEGIKNAHFLVNTMYNFRIEENMKVKNNPDMYYAVDKTEIGEGNMIPLWLFGFLY